MKKVIGRILKFIELMLDLITGVLGGAILGFVCSMMSFYLFTVLRFPWWYLLIAIPGYFVIFVLLGLIKPRYFQLLSIPLLTCLFTAGGGMEYTAGGNNMDDITWREFGAFVTLILSLVGLPIGILMSLHSLVIVCVTMFLIYLVFIPKLTKIRAEQEDRS